MKNKATDTSITAWTAKRGRAPLAPMLCCAMLVAAALPAHRADATPGAGVTPEPQAAGTLPEIVRTKLKGEVGGFEDGSDTTQIVVVKFTVAPGGYFGWHQHGGPVWAVVASGTLTLYEGDDTTCTGHPYTAGHAFWEKGDHTHNARNEGTTPVVVFATFMLPTGGAVRIDAPNPYVCTF